VFKLSSPEEVEAATIERQQLWNNRKAEHGPFDIVGVVHGCFGELVELMARLGYSVEADDLPPYSHPFITGDSRLEFDVEIVSSPHAG
jgi:protein phosphatase